MKVILTETIESLGIIGSEVKVADGYARNYLLPQKKAVLASQANRNMLKQEKARFELQIAKEKAFAQEMAARLEGTSCTIAAKVSDETRLYGSVTERDILNALAEKGLKLKSTCFCFQNLLKIQVLIIYRSGFMQMLNLK